MIRSRIKIGNGATVDFWEAYGFMYLDADERTGSEETTPKRTTYAEYGGENEDPRVTEAPYDYKAQFLVEAPNRNLENVNSVIKRFNDAIRVVDSKTGIRRRVEIEFYNLLNRVKIVGTPELVRQPSEVYHSGRYGELDWAVVELQIRVSKPWRCDYDLRVEELYETEKLFDEGDIELLSESGQGLESEKSGMPRAKVIREEE